jgi:hypothetical protein
MLREILGVRQISGEQTRRWFTSDTMDLIVWIDDAGMPAGFQLCYDKGDAEHAVTWKPLSGLSHLAVDDGESGGGLRYKATPMLMPNGQIDASRIARLFTGAAHDLPHVIRDFVIAKIGEGA